MKATPPTLGASGYTGLADRAAEASRLLKLLANERRLRLLCCLADGREMTVGALAAAVGLSQSALSQHLARMREQGLVAFRRDGHMVHYTVADPTVARFLATLKDIYCANPAPKG